MTSIDNLKRLEQMALLGCTNQEIESYFGCRLTPELRGLVQELRKHAPLCPDPQREPSDSSNASFGVS